MAVRPGPSITQIDVTLHRVPIRAGAIARGSATPEAIAAEGTRLGGLLKQAVNRGAPIAMTYGSERQLLAYAGAVSDFLVLELPKHMRAYDRRPIGVPNRIATIQGFRILRLTRRRTSGHVTASLAESMCVWVFRELGLASGRDFRRISQIDPPLVGAVCPDFLIRRNGHWMPCESKHIVDVRYLRRSANRGFTQVLGAMSGLSSPDAYLFVAIDSPTSAARYQAEVVELYV